MGNTVKFLLRVPRDVWEEMRRWADEENRSLNKQVVHVLRRAVSEWRGVETKE